MLRDEDIQNVRNVPMRQIAGMYGISVTRSGFAKCCFHADSNPSMKIYDGNRGYHCFVCHTGGDVIDFVMRHDGIGFEAAVRLIADYFGIPISDGKKPLSKADKDRIAKKRAAQEAAEKARKADKERLRAISRDIHWLEDRQTEFKPLGPVWCMMQNKIEKLEREWDVLFEAYGSK